MVQGIGAYFILYAIIIKSITCVGKDSKTL